MNITPQRYSLLSSYERRELRESYVVTQNGKCMWCNAPLTESPPKEITDLSVDWTLFPGGKEFLKHPVHLQHNHDTDMTEGAVHAYCNGVMWEYYGR